MAGLVPRARVHGTSSAKQQERQLGPGRNQRGRGQAPGPRGVAPAAPRCWGEAGEGPGRPARPRGRGRGGRRAAQRGEESRESGKGARASALARAGCRLPRTLRNADGGLPCAGGCGGLWTYGRKGDAPRPAHRGFVTEGGARLRRSVVGMGQNPPGRQRRCSSGLPAEACGSVDKRACETPPSSLSRA